MKRNWRERPATRRRRWRPWVSLRPTRGAGARIHEQRSVGLRDLVASPAEVGARPELRWRIIGASFLVLLALVMIRLVFLQVVEHAAAVEVVDSNSLTYNSIPALRGEIRDRGGDVLVGNNVTVQLQISRDDAIAHPAVVGALSALTGLSVKSIDATLLGKRYLPYQETPILQNASPAIQEYVKLHPSDFPGVNIVDAATRYYPLGGSLAPHVLGYVSDITQAEIDAHPGQGYSNQDATFGQNGIESFYEQYLRGTNGTETERIDALGDVIGSSKIKEPVVGDSVVLNLDAGLQQAVDTALADGIERIRTHPDPTTGVFPPAPDGAAIVLDPRNGAVLAMASYPNLDLSTPFADLSNKQYAALAQTGAFNNYAIQGLYTPGSTFKLASATAELQTGIFPADKYVDDTGTFKVPGCLQGADGCVFHDDESSGTGEVDLALALTRSSDYYFYNLGYLFWAQQDKYGKTPIQNVAAQYGLGQLTNIDLPYEVQGRVDSPTERLILHREAPRAFPNTSWYTGDNIEMAFGQGSTAVTPIEMAEAYATFANGGTRYQPEVAAGIVSPRGKVVIRYAPRVLDHVSLPPSVRDPILAGLEGVVNDPSGTAYQPFHTYTDFSLAAFPIAGKTGTADDKVGQEPNSWFVGFGPVNHPEYVVLCVVAEGGYGADGAAPVVAQIFNYLVAHPIKPVNFTAVHLASSPSGSNSR